MDALLRLFRKHFKRKKTPLPDDAVSALIVDAAYKYFLGRSPDPVGYTAYIRSLKNGLSASTLFRDLALSEEARGRTSAESSDHALIVDVAYRYILGHAPDAGELNSHVNALENGLQVSDLFQLIALSNEAQSVRAEGPRVWGVESREQELSDGEFIACVGEFLFPAQGATPLDIERWRRFLREEPHARGPFVLARFREAHVAIQLHQEEPLHDPTKVWIMGTSQFLTPEVWRKRKDDAVAAGRIGVRATVSTERADFKHTGEYVVSAIASLYRGKKLPENFPG